MKQNWKKVSIKKIAQIANVGTATVDRVLYNRKGVRKETKIKVLKALDFLEYGKKEKKKIFLFCQSGNSYNVSLQATLNKILSKNNLIEIDSEFILTRDKISKKIEKRILEDEEYDGLISVSTENPIINNIVQNFINKRKPCITLTSDLSQTKRNAYVGNDQVAAGSTAAKLLTSLNPSSKNKKGELLMVISQPFRCQQERELGFKKIIRYEFPKLNIRDGIQTTDTSEESYKHIKKYIKEYGPPSGIYNITGGNKGIAEAIKDCQCEKIPFVGHELNKNTKTLLDKDQIDYVISHDLEYELSKSISLINDFYNNFIIEDFKTNILIFNKHNCTNEKEIY